MTNVISSEKIMEKLKQIKRTFGQSSGTLSHNFKNSDLQLKQNQKLKQYLPQSINKFAAQNTQYTSGFKESDKNAITFRKALQQKLQNLFNEEKDLLRKRYQMNWNSQNYQNDLKQLEQRYKKKGESNRPDIKKQLENNHIKQMEDKIKILQHRFKNIEDQDRASVQSKTEQVQYQSSNQKQSATLRQELLQLKKQNQRLLRRIQKKKSEESRIQNNCKKDKKFQQEISQLKKELQLLKLDKQQCICPARVKSRQRNQSTRQQSKRKVDHEILLELYSQIDELKYKLNRQSKEKLVLEEKNSWLEEQLKKFINK